LQRLVEPARQQNVAPLGHFANRAAYEKFVHVQCPLSADLWLTPGKRFGELSRYTLWDSPYP
jgi:hypothetical protein